MTEKKVIVSERVRRDLELITDEIMLVTSVEFAEQYERRLETEIATLSYLATALPECQWMKPKRYHKDAKTMTIGHRKLTVIFHVEGDYVIVDKILPSCMITF